MEKRLPVLEDLPSPEGKHVLVRTDFNVPMADDRITDDLRIRLSLDTLTWLLDHGAATITTASHLGRPKGKPDPVFDMAPVRARLHELLVAVGAEADRVEVLDNLRFDPREEAGDLTFAADLVAGQDLFVNDAFGVAHRPHASVIGPPLLLPSAAGRIMAHEVEVLDRLLHGARRPFVAVLGGSKVSDKLGVIESLLTRVDALLIGGGMCFTFLAAKGHEVGASLFEPEQVDACAQLLASGSRIMLPIDLTILSPGGLFGSGADRTGEVRHVGVDVPEGWIGLDIGPGTAAVFSDVITESATVLWNGPMGVFEDPRFAAGTLTVGEAVAAARAFTVVGGGDSAAALAAFGLADRVDHVSTGGGASLEFIEHGDLPGLAALRGPARVSPSRRRPLISGNWKMHLTHLDAIAVVQKLAFGLDRNDRDRAEVSVHPPFTALRSVQTLIDADDLPIALGAQDVHWLDSGAFTGEISPLMLSKLNVRYVIVGHSERRQYFAETDETANKKVAAVLRAGMTPILCVGETLEEREAGGTEDKVVGQVRAGLVGVDAVAVAGVVVAYEPIWAIGTGRTATPEDAQSVCGLLRSEVKSAFGPEAAAAVRIQYGGSVKASNIADLMAKPDIDGALVGGASLDPVEFAQIVEFHRS